jgi:alpha,alpha-trehalase
MKTVAFICMIYLPAILLAQQTYPPAPDQLYGQLFVDVQLQQVLPDGKTFVDALPKRKVADIMYDYGMMKGPQMNLKKFVEDNFNLPAAPPSLNYIQRETSTAAHIRNLWQVLRREADVSPGWEGKEANGSSLLALPYPYIVPGGRFREIYYWDSYFTMLGLAADNQVEMLQHMVNNFDYLIYNFGHIPNGNRTYYLSRSQPPFFSMMVALLATKKGDAVYKKYLSSMQKEYAYWMEGIATIKTGEPYKRLVKMPNGALLNRYWDDSNQPRPESYKEDTETADAAAAELAMRIKVASPEALKKILDEKRQYTWQALRAGACSGWDFSSRWLARPAELASIQTTSIVPVDLNCLLYQTEMLLAKALQLSDKKNTAAIFSKRAANRKAAIIKYCWDAKQGYFFDYNIADGQQQQQVTAAGIFPLYVNMASVQQATAVTAVVAKQLLKPGGLVTTTVTSGQQWDAPNGWAPLQWVAVKGLNNYSAASTDARMLARLIAQRWLGLNDKVYNATGKMMEKYNVVDINQPAGGGEYPSQDGFGWTNGVYLALKKYYKQH